MARPFVGAADRLLLPSGGCQEATEPAACELAGGMAFGACSTCAQVNCPWPGCVGATGSCSEVHDTPGCDDPVCCSYRCSQNPACCTDAWDESCLSPPCVMVFPGGRGCTPGGACTVYPTPHDCYNAGCTPTSSACGTDANEDGIDDACLCDIARPKPVPPTLRVGRVPDLPEHVAVQYDHVTCSASDHMLLIGRFSEWQNLVLGDCSIGSSGAHVASLPTGNDLWFVVVRRDGSLHGSFGESSSGERQLFGVTTHCGPISRWLGESCP